MALLSMALLQASTTHIDVQDARSLPASLTSTGHLQETAIARAEPPVGNPAGIDALAGILAKKYRISEVATREFVLSARREGSKSGIDPLLLLAVMAVESRFNPVAQSDGGAMGLMQVIPRYHAEKFETADRAEVLDPPTNIHVGARILKECISRGGNEIAGLQLYNGAPTDTTNAYATRVLGEMRWLQDALHRAMERARA
ncbi:MAG: lytic transglycosylase domain-containing protein [Casimicrobiaceae bacterium]